MTQEQTSHPWMTGNQHAKKEKKRDKRVSAMVPGEMKDKIKAATIAQGCTESDLVYQMLQERFS